jgi:hypothetical protein
MRNGLTFLVSAVLALTSIGANADDTYVAKADEELFQTWTNDNMYPQKTVDFLGGYKDYSLLSDGAPSTEAREQIMSKSIDSSGNVWYRTFGTVTKGKLVGMQFQRLIEVSESGTVMEMAVVLNVYAYNPSFYPTKIDPHGDIYRVYHLGGF